MKKRAALHALATATALLLGGASHAQDFPPKSP